MWELIDTDDGLVVVIQNRVSTTQQLRGVSLQVQEELCREIMAEMAVKAKRLLVTNEVDSGAFEDREVYQNLKKMVTEKSVDLVLAYDTDRIARDPILALLFARLCKDNGVMLRFVDGTAVRTKFDEVVQFLKGFAADTEREKIMERTMDSKKKLARDGRYPIGIGRGTYGYDYDPVTKKRMINEEEAAVVRLIYSLRVSGMAVHRIARLLNEKEIPTKNGYQWESRQVRAILKNEAYIGRQYYGKARHVKLPRGRRMTTVNPKEEWILVEGWSPVIIDEAIWYKVQTMWGKPQSPSVTKKRQFPLTGILRCGDCGSTMSGRCEKRRWSYYLCAGTRTNAKRHHRICWRRQIRAGETEAAVMGCLSEALKEPSGVIEELREYLGTGGGDLGDEIKRLRREITKREGEVKSYSQQRAQDKIEEKEFTDLVAPVRLVLTELRESLAALEEQQKLRDHEAEVEEKIRACFAEYRDDLDGLDANGWHALMLKFGVEVVSTDDELLVMASLDPGLFTIEHTSASMQNHSFVLPVKPAYVRWPDTKAGRPRKK